MMIYEKERKRISQLVRVLLLTLGCTSIMLLTAITPIDHIAHADENEIEVIESGGRVMYKYTDQNGNVVVQDTPPEEYFQIDHDGLDVPVIIPTPTIEVDRFYPVKTTPVWLTPVLWISAALSFIGAAALLLLPHINRRRNELPIDRFIRQAGFSSFHDVQLSDGKRRHATVDRLVKTPSGILLINTNQINGTITGKPNQKEWRVERTHDVTATANPLLLLEHAKTLTQEIIGDVSIYDRVVDSGNAKYASGRPSKIQKLTDFKENLEHFADPNSSQSVDDAAWRLLMGFPRSNVIRTKHYREDWLGIIQKHWRSICSGVLVLISVILIIIILLIVR